MPVRKPLISKERLLMLVANGLSDVKIATACKVSRKSVERYRHMWNIPPGTPDGRHGVARVANEAAKAAREKLVPMGKGGDAEFWRRLAGRSFEDVVNPAPRRVAVARAIGALMA